MIAKPDNTLVKRLMDRLKAEKMPVTKFAEDIGIPKDRIYKWFKKGGSPKADDAEKLKNWLDGTGNGISDKVPRGTEGENQRGQPNAIDWHQKYIDNLERTNKLLEDLIKTNLSGLATGQQLIVAMVKTGLQMQAEIAAAGDKNKKNELIGRIDKYTADNLGLQQEKDKHATLHR